MPLLPKAEYFYSPRRHSNRREINAIVSPAAREWCGAYVVGVETDERLAAIARGKLDHIILGDAEKFEVPKACGEFDLVLCTDILEHLRDPEALLCKLKGAMSPGGLILISVPNVRNWHVLYSLIAKGEWEYRDSGLLDKTHLRFFTRRSLCRMITRAGYKILEVRPKVRVSASTGARCALIKLIGFLLPRDFLTYQFLVTARKSSAVPSETERAEGAQE